MKFARITFTVAGVWGILVLTPLFFIIDQIGRQDPPPITHPGFYYGFATVGLAWQVVFLIIGRDPVRFRPIMLAALLEKFPFVIAQTILFRRHEIKTPDLSLAGVDLLLGILFIVAYVKTAPVRVGGQRQT